MKNQKNLLLTKVKEKGHIISNSQANYLINLKDEFNYLSYEDIKNEDIKEKHFI